MTPRDRIILARLTYAFPVVFMFQVMLPEVVSWFTNPVVPSVSQIYGPFNWLNPWIQGCPNINKGNEFTGCWGTNWGHFGGPYSIMWYWSMYGLSLAGSIPNLFTLFLIGTGITILLWFRNRAFVVPFSILNAIFMLAFPQNLLSHYLTTGSLLAPASQKLRYRFTWAISAVAWKLPIGAGLDVWRFAFTRSVPDPVNWFPYGLLGVWTLATLGYVIRTRHTHSSNTRVRQPQPGEARTLLPSPRSCHTDRSIGGLGGLATRLSC